MMGARGADKGKYYELNGGKGVDTEKIPVALKTSELTVTHRVKRLEISGDILYSQNRRF